jgi:phospholipid-binding lipoprotein MlaA
VAALCLGGCASTSGPGDPRDPFEKVNRVTYSVNSNLDKYLLKPVAQGYNFILPQPVRTCVNNVFGNIGDLSTMANNFLEGNFSDAGSDACRIAINSTVGLLGCIDVASSHGFTKHRKDFGITLGVWGVSPGPYVVLPFFGPSDVRDSVGLVGDLYSDPVGYVYPVWQRNTAEGIRIIDTRASLISAGNLLSGAALDEYVFVRDGYLTRRRYLIYNGNPPDDYPADDSDQNDQPDNKQKSDKSDKKQ